MKRLLRAARDGARGLTVIAWGVLALVAPAACTQNAAQQGPGPAAPSLPLATDPPTISLGTLRPGEVGKSAMTVRNNGTEALTVARVETSCPCVRVSPPTVRVEPGKSAPLEVVFDPAEEPDFRGQLSVELVGKGEDDRRLFETRVKVGVESSDPAKGKTP